MTTGNFGTLLSSTADDPTKRLGTYCIVVSAAKVDIVALDRDSGFDAAINELRGRLIRKARLETFEDVRNTLYEMLISPVIPFVPPEAKRIVIVPDGALAFLPFDVLRKDSQSGDLGSHYAISLSPSISVSILSQAQGKAGGSGVVALGGGWYDSGKGLPERSAEQPGYTRSGDSVGGDFSSVDESGALSTTQMTYFQQLAMEEGAGAYFAERGFSWCDLPGTLDEINDIGTRAFAGMSPLVLSGMDASEAEIKELSRKGVLKDCAYVHLACHGYFDSLVPEMSSMVLSEVSGLLVDDQEDGYLTLGETALLDLDADMVCLSACDTGLGQVKRGDGMVGFSRAFMIAGAKRVGVSLWSVDDEATAEFMTRLYRAVIQEHLDFSEAYARVKEEFRNDPTWSHPFYWSAFTIYE